MNQRLLKWLLAFLGAGFLLVAAMMLVQQWLERSVGDEAKAIARRAAEANAMLLASELQKFRLLPIALAQDPDVIAGAKATSRPEGHKLDEKLEALAQRTEAAVIYLIDAQGTTIAASNWRQPTSFVDQNYGFRPYFGQAMKRGSSEVFALGTVSRHPGLYLAQRIAAHDGVVVVKIEFDRIERAWRDQAGDTYITDGNGIVLITSRFNWRFLTDRAVPALTQKSLLQGNLYGATRFASLPRTIEGNFAFERSKPVSAVGRAEVAFGGGQLVYLEPLAPHRLIANRTAQVFLLVLVVLVGSATAIAFRAIEGARMRKESRAALELAVAQRTSELAQVLEDRESLNLRYRTSREELAQASRLATLGEVTAGVAHELNQPIATMKLYAENAHKFLSLKQSDMAQDNMLRIAALADRMGKITGELKAFARQKTPEPGPVSLVEVLAGVQLLLAHRLSEIDFHVGDVPSDPLMFVHGDRVRLEQILVNLIQNSIEAFQANPSQSNDLLRVSIEGERSDTHITLMLSDNGPGISEAVRKTLFEPFVTSKENGLGLGLSIAQAIALDFGATLSFVEASSVGTTFKLTLKRTAA